MEGQVVKPDVNADVQPKLVKVKKHRPSLKMQYDSNDFQPNTLKPDSQEKKIEPVVKTKKRKTTGQSRPKIAKMRKVAKSVNQKQTIYRLPLMIRINGQKYVNQSLIHMCENPKLCQSKKRQ